MIICLTLLCGYVKAHTRGGDSSPPLPKEISAELFDKAVELLNEFYCLIEQFRRNLLG